uniref:Ig-like domain-containing protein n=1 Tax=Cyclopterus lumpus TaxID=8103 RepID=A0A8C3B0H4_CYCLU
PPFLSLLLLLLLLLPLLSFILFYYYHYYAVDCVLGGSCILPCSFPPGGEVVLYWIQVATGNTIHYFYNNQDQVEQQDQHFRGRTSLFKDQISRGNASLRLTGGVKVQDEGKYECYISQDKTGVKSSFINLKVDAPVRKVDIRQLENRITCSSEGIYPEPTLTWTTKPPFNETLQNQTTVPQTEQQLYSISSFLVASAPGLDYSCTVSTRVKEAGSDEKDQISDHLSSSVCFQPTSVAQALKQRSAAGPQKVLQQASSGGSTTVRSS